MGMASDALERERHLPREKVQLRQRAATTANKRRTATNRRALAPWPSSHTFSPSPGAVQRGARSHGSPVDACAAARATPRAPRVWSYRGQHAVRHEKEGRRAVGRKTGAAAELDLPDAKRVASWRHCPCEQRARKAPRRDTLREGYSIRGCDASPTLFTRARLSLVRGDDVEFFSSMVFFWFDAAKCTSFLARLSRARRLS